MPGRLAAAAFVLRCAGAAVLALLIASWAGLDYPVWATVSALVVSQDRLGDTRRTLGWRLVATAVGIGVAIAVGSILAGAGPGMTLGVAVAICAALVRWRSDLRLSMWTAAIVLLTVAPGQGIAQAGFARGVEVLIGCLSAQRCINWRRWQCFRSADPEVDMSGCRHVGSS